MKKLLLLPVLMAAVVLAFGQDGVIKKNTTATGTAKTQYDKKKIKSHIPISKTDYIGVVIGQTKYDLQSNSAVAKRIINHGNGKISATWTQAHGASPFPNRGSGYNYNADVINNFLAGWEFYDASGNQTIETDRCGWPAMLSNGTNETVVAHVKSTPGLFANTQVIGAAGQNWTASNIDGGPEAMLWPRAASSGDNYYVIAVDDYVNDQTEIEAVHLYKSEDAGANWEYKGILPDFNTYYAQGQGDTYAIDAKGDNVAIVQFGKFADTRLWKSTDRGETWTQMCINDFPIDAYDLSGGVMVDMDNNNVADTVYTTDGTGDVIIDSEGKVHVVFSKFRVLDEDASDGYSTYFSYVDGLYYWNEDMGEGQFTGVTSPDAIDMAVPEAVEEIAYSFDLNENNIIWEFDTEGLVQGEWAFGSYGTGLTTFSNLGVDAENNIYCAFSTVMEGDAYLKIDAFPNKQQYRHIYIMARKDGTWRTPVLISGDVPLSENVFPTVARDVDQFAYLWYQSDNEPGLHVNGDEDPVTDNLIIFKKIPVNDLFQLAVAVTSVSITPTSATLFLDETQQLTATVAPINATNQNVTWSSSDDNIATVDENGLVRAVAVGEATITVTTNDGGFTASSAITVEAVAVTGISLNTSTATLNVSETLQLNATIQPENATNQNVTWSSSDNSIATVNENGLVTGVAEGTATITVTTEDGNFTATCTVTVETTTVAVTGVSVNPTTTAMLVDGTQQLSATIAPTNATNQNVTWTSDMQNIATVSATGLVEGVAVGTANIIVSTEDGNFTDTCVVTVGPNGIKENIAEIINIYPNPTAGIINLKSSERILNASIQDITGKIIRKLNVENNETINLADIENGIYIIKIQTANKVFSGKIIKE